MFWQTTHKALLGSVAMFLAVTAGPSMVLAAERNVPSQYSTIQAAINACSESDVVVIAQGTYTGPGNRDMTFGGKAITVRSTDPTSAAVVAGTVIDCQGSASDNHRAFEFNLTGEDADSVVSGLTIKNGYMAESGGAIYVNGTKPTIMNCRFVNNTSETNGGALSLGNAPTVVDCTFEGNTAERGGGISCSHSGASISGCLFINNSGVYHGGGVSCSSGMPTITNCVFKQNQAADGGGIWLHSVSSYTKLLNSVFYDNESTYWGGAISCNSASPDIMGCTLVSNEGGYYGGGISFKANSNPDVRNCILWANTAGNGPQIELRSTCTVTMSYCDVQGGQGQAYVDSGNTLNWAGGNITADPSIADEDCHLAEGSPCINAGDTSPSYSGETDTDGEDRVSDGRVDIGADEYGSPSQPGDTYTLEVKLVTADRGSVTVSPQDPDELPDGFSQGTQVTLTAVPVEGKTFIGWEIFDPNHPGDSNYIEFNENSVLNLVMNADWEVKAIFSCGSEMGPLVPMVLPLALGMWFVAGRKRR